MDTKPVFESLVRTGVVPVIRTGSREDALEVARALEEGGLPVVEITMTTPGAIAVIEELVLRWGDRVLVGAGTVTDVDTCSRALGAGCRFVVTPAGN
ncbi:MAG: bifunctional 4-hydroxy-2-oxoglutarate aldolase/2-dehydro-3-deoxy-phosphogluconate aldolase, partial [bacterium]